MYWETIVSEWFNEWIRSEKKDADLHALWELIRKSTSCKPVRLTRIRLFSHEEQLFIPPHRIPQRCYGLLVCVVYNVQIVSMSFADTCKLIDQKGMFVLLLSVFEPSRRLDRTTVRSLDDFVSARTLYQSVRLTHSHNDKDNLSIWLIKTVFICFCSLLVSIFLFLFFFKEKETLKLHCIYLFYYILSFFTSLKISFCNFLADYVSPDLLKYILYI